VLAAAGEKIFCAGMDLRAFSEVKEGEHLAIDQRFIDFQRIGVRKPTVAAVNGAAVGGGFELMLGCDMAVVAEHARFGVPEVKVGLVPGGGGTLLPRRIPPAIAFELALTGELFTSARAMSLGLVNAVVPGPEVLTTAVDLARRIAANAPLAAMAIKQALRAAADGTAADGWAKVDEVNPGVAASEDAKEGARAFTEKRPPNWKGR
jgi:enoyl-CoA hydratase